MDDTPLVAPPKRRAFDSLLLAGTLGTLGLMLYRLLMLERRVDHLQGDEYTSTLDDDTLAPSKPFVFRPISTPARSASPEDVRLEEEEAEEEADEEAEEIDQVRDPPPRAHQNVPQEETEEDDEAAP